MVWFRFVHSTVRQNAQVTTRTFVANSNKIVCKGVKLTSSLDGKDRLKLPRFYSSYASLSIIFFSLICSFWAFVKGYSLCIRLLNYSARSFFVLHRLNITWCTYFFFLFTDRLSKVKVSQIKSNFIFLSKGLSVPNDERWFISINHGFRLLSIIMSRPNIWKHIEFSRSSD